MNRLSGHGGCIIPPEVFRSLFVLGVAGVISVSSIRLVGLGVSHNVIIGLIGFFLVGAVLVLQGLSILRKPGLVLLVGVTTIAALVRFQYEILSLL
jgi:hypothetical protein